MSRTIEINLCESPYPGLRPFLHNEADIFFGREEQTDQLLDKLRSFRFIAVVGPSGSGKSSLVRAGLISSLGVGLLTQAGTRWRVAEMRPGEEPLERLAKALMSPSALGSEHGSDPEEIAFVKATLQRGPLGLIEVLREKPLPPGANLLLLVDQFEEIFRFSREGDADEASAFVALLLATVKSSEARVYVVITMRSDFLGDCALFMGLPEVMNDCQFLTPRLKREQSEAAIVGPAKVFDGSLDPQLVNRLLNDMASDPDQLPLLQHVLMRLWARAKERSTEAIDGGKSEDNQTGAHMTLEDYSAVGTLSDALSQHVDEIYNSLTDEQKKIAKVLFRRLAERSLGQRDTRKPARAGDVASVAGVPLEELIAVVDEFRKPDRSFITPPQGVPIKEGTMLDIGHESLIWQWKRLDRWVNKEANSAAGYQRLKQTALLWKNEDASPWRGIDLDRARDWRDKEAPSAAWASRYGSDEEYALAMEFLEYSERQREAELLEAEKNEEAKRQQELDNAKLQAKANAETQNAKKFRLLAMALGWVVLLLAASGAWALNERSSAKDQTRLAELKSLEALAQAERAATQEKIARDNFQKAEDNAEEARRQQGLAESAATLARKNADEAERQKVLAENAAALARKNEDEAKTQQDLALNAAKLARENEKKAKDNAEEVNRQKELVDQAVKDLREQKAEAERLKTEAKEGEDNALIQKAEAEKARDAAVAALAELKKERENRQDCLQEKGEQEELVNLLTQQAGSAVSGTKPTVSNGKLEIVLVDVYGSPIKDEVEIALMNQFSSTRNKTLNDVDASKPISITGLAVTPRGTYRVLVKPKNYLPAAQFINIKSGVTTQLTLTLPLDASKADNIDFPDFNNLPEPVQSLLARSFNVEGFGSKAGKDLYVDLDELRRAGLLNIVAKSDKTLFKNGRSVLSYMQELRGIRGERLSVVVDKELLDLIKSAENRDTFHQVSSALYVAPPGYQIIGSFKTVDDFARLQLTFFSGGDTVIAEIDIDEAGGLSHVFQVTQNQISGSRTHPYNIQQLLVKYQKIDPLYRIKR